jgi:hypothetical protein
MPQPSDLNDPEPDALAAELQRLAPRPASLDRDRLLFEAGRASAPRVWPWQLIAGAGVLTSLLLAVGPVFRPPTVVERVVYVPRDEPPVHLRIAPPIPDRPDGPSSGSPEQPSPLTRYQLLQEKLLRWGLDGVEREPPLLPPQKLDPL